MSHATTDLITCPQIQEDLNTQFGQFDPLGGKDVQGFTDFVVSPTNTDGMLQSKVAAGGGKVRSVELVYTQPLLESVVSTSPAKKCTSTNAAGQSSHTYEIDITAGVQYDETFDLLKMAYMCKENSLWIAQQIQRMMDVLSKKIGTINATQLALLNGAYATGDTVGTIANDTKTIRTRKTIAGDTQFDISGLEEISFSAVNNGYASTPFLFGFGEIYKYMQKLAVGCCANEGINYGDYANAHNIIFVPDKKVNAALGGNGFMMIQPGAVQMLSWLEFEGANGINMIDTDIYKQTVIVNPKNGLRFDMQWTNSCGNININLKLAHKLVALPSDLYSVGDPYHNVNWIHQFDIVNS